MEVTPRSSGFPGEAGSGQLGTLSVPSVVPEGTLDGSVGPTLVASSSFTAVSSRTLLVDGSGSSSHGSSLCDGYSRTVSFPTCSFMVEVLIWEILFSQGCGLHRSRDFTSTAWR
ncbi:hypothetical protein E2C01_052218 [Portunus trituberculatus]|uniref:Uncharacterized protein n=1 Tax=Portunus trituberculatus TaxID=210409 RepID=A0A5B7GGY9_PORTR|nr:hypothetical protein [Portunus trituberculatus]